MVNQVIDLSGGSEQYSEFLGLQNTKLGQWFNKTFPTKKKYDEAVAKAKLYDAQNSQSYNSNVDKGAQDENKTVVPSAKFEVIGIPQYEFNDVFETTKPVVSAPGSQQEKEIDGAQGDGDFAVNLGNQKKSNAWIWWLGGAVVVAGAAVLIVKKYKK